VLAIISGMYAQTTGQKHYVSSDTVSGGGKNITAEDINN